MAFELLPIIIGCCTIILIVTIDRKKIVRQKKRIVNSLLYELDLNLRLLEGAWVKYVSKNDFIELMSSTFYSFNEDRINNLNYLNPTDQVSNPHDHGYFFKYFKFTSTPPPVRIPVSTPILKGILRDGECWNYLHKRILINLKHLDLGFTKVHLLMQSSQNSNGIPTTNITTDQSFLKASNGLIFLLDYQMWQWLLFRIWFVYLDVVFSYSNLIQDVDVLDQIRSAIGDSKYSEFTQKFDSTNND
ncbi:hypothetical protein KAI78_08990 [bacterium]|nr:hypothetical protein [bacterium]